MKKKLQKLIATILLTVIICALWLVAWISCASAQPVDETHALDSEVTPPVLVKQGDPAPFTGALMAVEDAAKLVAEVHLLRSVSESRASELEQCYEERDDALGRVMVELPPVEVIEAPCDECPECLCPDCDEWVWGLAGVGVGVLLGVGVAVGLAVGL